jgi:hypothetical protein
LVARLARPHVACGLDDFCEALDGTASELKKDQLRRIVRP